MCANVNMGAVIVGYGIAVYGRLSFTNDAFVFWCFVLSILCLPLIKAS